MIAPLFERLRHKDRNALARLLSHAARGEYLDEMQAGLPVPAADHAARVVAFTGSAGVGKSSLLGELIGVVRDQGLTVAVLACDPQSPLSGGALLGDRFRMGSSPDDGVFIRSLAAVGGRGALADHLAVMIRLLESFGFDVIFLETVGSGQGDVEVRGLADAVVLMVQPETGDDVQWEKAGILECADLVVVHKADLPSAEQTAVQVRAALDLSPARPIEVLRVSSKLSQGHAELWQAIQALPRRRNAMSAVQVLWQEARALLERRFHAAEQRRDPELEQLVQRWQRGEESTLRTVQALVHMLSQEEQKCEKGIT